MAGFEFLKGVIRESDVNINRFKVLVTSLNGVNKAELSEADVTTIALRLETIKDNLIYYRDKVQNAQLDPFNPKVNPEKPKTKREKKRTYFIVIPIVCVVSAVPLLFFGGIGAGIFGAIIDAFLNTDFFSTLAFWGVIGILGGVLLVGTVAPIVLLIIQSLSPMGEDDQQLINSWEQKCFEIEKENDENAKKYKDLQFEFAEKRRERLQVLDANIASATAYLSSFYQETKRIPSKYYGNIIALQYVVVILNTSQYSLREAFEDYENELSRGGNKIILGAQHQQNALINESNAIAARARRDANIFCPNCGNAIIEGLALCANGDSYMTSGAPSKRVSVDSCVEFDTVLQKINTSYTIWLVIGIFQILIGLCGTITPLFVGIWNIIGAISRKKMIEQYRKNPDGLVKTVKGWESSIILFIFLNLIFGGLIGVAGGIYDYTIVRYVEQHERELVDAGA